METVRPVALGLHQEGKTSLPTDQSSTSLGVNIGDIPLDEPMLMILSNETATGLRVGFPATANSPVLAANAERQMIVTAGLVKNASGRSTVGSGVAVSWSLLRVAR